MQGNITEVLYRINEGQPINKELLSRAFQEIPKLDNEQRDICMGEIFTGMLISNPSSQEVYDLLEAVFSLDNYKRELQPFHNTKKTVIEYIGSGKKGVKTINVSTPSAMLASASGACILKKGSRSTSSVTGSADFMSIVGCKQTIDLDKINNALEKVNFAFVNIENVIPRFDHIYNGKFLVPHVLSLGLPAIVTPLRGDKILYGLAHSEVKESAKVLKHYNLQGAVVSTNIDDVHHIDELCPIGEAKCVYTHSDNRLLYCKPSNYKKNTAMSINEIKQRNDPRHNVLTVLKILNGKGSLTQNYTICMNSAMLLLLSDLIETLDEGIEVSYQKLYARKGIEKLEEYLEFMDSDMDKYYALKKECSYV